MKISTEEFDDFTTKFNREKTTDFDQSDITFRKAKQFNIEKKEMFVENNFVVQVIVNVVVEVISKIKDFKLWDNRSYTL